MTTNAATIPFPAQITQRLRASRPGVGFLFYHAGDEVVAGVEFCIGRNNQMAHVQSGTPVYIETNEEGEVYRYKVVLERVGD